MTINELRKIVREESVEAMSIDYLRALSCGEDTSNLKATINKSSSNKKPKMSANKCPCCGHTKDAIVPKTGDGKMDLNALRDLAKK